MLYRCLPLCLFVFFAIASSAQATLIVKVNDAIITAGSTGFVDVTIESDSLVFGDLLQQFGIEFRITTGGATRLEFFNPQPDPQLTDPTYVFFGDSTDVNFPLPFGAVSTTVVPNDTFIGGDATWGTDGTDGTDVTVTSVKLLAPRTHYGHRSATHCWRHLYY